LAEFNRTPEENPDSIYDSGSAWPDKIAVDALDARVAFDALIS